MIYFFAGLIGKITLFSSIVSILVGSAGVAKTVTNLFNEYPEIVYSIKDMQDFGRFENGSDIEEVLEEIGVDDFDEVLDEITDEDFEDIMQQEEDESLEAAEEAMEEEKAQAEAEKKALEEKEAEEKKAAEEAAKAAEEAAKEAEEAKAAEDAAKAAAPAAPAAPAGKVEIGRVYMEDCGMDTGYWIVTYSDGTIEYIDE